MADNSNIEWTDKPSCHHGYETESAHLFAYKPLTLYGYMRINIRTKEVDQLETNSRKIIKRLKKEGFVLVNTVGSHHKFTTGEMTVTVPHPKKDLPVGTVRNIYKQAGWL